MSHDPPEDPLKIYSAAEVLKNYKEKEKNEYSKMLYTMAIGLNSAEIREAKCKELIKDKVIKVSDVKPSIPLMKHEVDRRNQIVFTQENDQGVPRTERLKPPAPKWWGKKQLEPWLKSNRQIHKTNHLSCRPLECF